MVRKIKVSDVIESQGAQEEAAPPTTTQEPATPEPEEHVNTEPTNVDVFETNPELPPTAVVEAAGGDATAELPTPKPKRSPRKKKEKAEEVMTMTTTSPPTPIEDPPAPEVEVPAEEIKISPPKAKAKPRAKPKAKTKPTPNFPTHDDEGQRIRPPPSLERPTKPETPEEFWHSTLKNMKEQKDRQYATLIQAAF